MSLDDRLKSAEEKTDINPTESQKIKGNYKKGKIILKKFKITIENPKDSIRSGVDKDGNKWESKMNYTYGYFNGTVGKDGDQVDVFIGNSIDEDFFVYVIDQVDEETRAFDEHKVMFGFMSELEAKEAYLSCYDDSWKGFQSITKFEINKFRKWLNDADALKYAASKQSLSSRIDIKNNMNEDVRVIELYGEVLSEETLMDLKNQAGELKKGDTLAVKIASPGGSVSEGLEIMMWLDSLSLKGIEIITIVVGNSYSIASLIMLAADRKFISKHGEIMVHNPMIPELEYVNANELEKHVKDLRDLEEVMYYLYQTFTNLDKNTIKELMDNETYLSPKDAIKYGFADSILDIKPKSFEMAVKQKINISMSKTFNVLNKVIGKINGADFINQLYYTESGDEIEISQGDSSTYKVGDSVSEKDGVIKLSDGAQLTIEEGKIKEINRDVENLDEDQPNVDVVEDSFNEGEAPKLEVVEEVIEEEVVEDTPIEKSKDAMPGKVVEKTESTITTKETVATEIKELSSWEVSVINESFEIGDVVEYKPYKEGDDPKSVGAGEYLLDDGRKILTNSDGVIKYIEPSQGGEVANEVVEESKVIENKEESDIEEKMKALEDLVNNKLDEIAKSIKASNKKSNDFEELVTEAIDTLAKNTSSAFKPDAQAIVKEEFKGSIFQKLRAKAQSK